MSDIEIKSLSEATDLQLLEAWHEGFVDYRMKVTNEQLSAMFKRRGINNTISYGAIKDGKIVSFVLNAIGNYNGVQTIYDTSTGTAMSYRRQGLATRIYQESDSFLRSLGATQYILEVLSVNQKAIDLYKKCGFELIREYYIFREPKEKITISSTKTTPSNIRVEVIQSLPSDSDCRAMWDVTPSWQNSIESIQRSIETFQFVGAFDDRDGLLVGYGVIEVLSGDIPQIAVKKEYRRQGIASSIFSKLLEFNQSPIVRVVNVDITGVSLVGFLKSIGFPDVKLSSSEVNNVEGHYEMRKMLI